MRRIERNPEVICRIKIPEVWKVFLPYILSDLLIVTLNPQLNDYLMLLQFFGVSTELYWGA